MIDRAMVDSALSRKDKIEWLYNRRTELGNKCYRGEQLTPDEKTEINRIDERLEEMDAEPYVENMAKLAAYVRRLYPPG